MTKLKIYILIAFFCFILSACQTATTGDESLRGQILLWHTWQPAETVVMDEMLTRFNDIHPEVVVVSTAISADDWQARYAEAATQGLGPDLIIGENAGILPLAQAGLIRDLTDDITEPDRYLTAAIQTLTYDDKLYGLPLSLYPMALYYNPTMVEEPATTVDDLLIQANAGTIIALNSSFEGAFWGIQAFGGRLFDEDGRVVLDQGGFANWLAWLKTAQDTPGIIFSPDDFTLRRIFMDGEAAYYIGSSLARTELEANMQPDKISVIPLPTGPIGPSGPLLQVETLMLNTASTPNQSKIALALANFLTNSEQNRTLVRELERIPANVRVRVDPNLRPIVNAFLIQARTAVPTYNLPQMEDVRNESLTLYSRVLEGIVGFQEAAVEVTTAVNENYDFESLEVPSPICNSFGDLLVWHSWSGAKESELQTMSAEFSADCPNATVTVESFAEADLKAQILQIRGQENAPDLIIAPDRWLVELADRDAIIPINTLTDRTLIQRYLPTTTEALEYKRQLYGLPHEIELTTLFYDTDQVGNPPPTLSDLLAQATTGNEVALSRDFIHASWGVPAFDGQLFDNEGRVILDQNGYLEWLTWLWDAQRTPGVNIAPVLNDETEGNQLEALATGQVAYYIGSSSELNILESLMGAERLGVAALPAGPMPAGSLLQVEAFFFTNKPEPQLELAMSFATYMTTEDRQERMMLATGIVPANINVPTDELPAMRAIRTQVQNAVTLPKLPQLTTVLAEGNQLYNELLSEDAIPSKVACEFAVSINSANGFLDDFVSRCEEPPTLEEYS